MSKLKTLAFKEPQVKYNLKLTPSDFREATDTGWEKQLLGEDIYIIDIKIPFKYLYVPLCPFDVYLYSTKYANLMKAPQGIFVLMDIVDKIILVKPSNVTSGNLYFQYWLSNVESVKILDIYNKLDFSINVSAYELMEVPFPTYKFRLLIVITIPSTDWDLEMYIYPYPNNTPLMLEHITGLGSDDTIINNIYEYNFIGGSGAVTNPHYNMPSFRTTIRINNKDSMNILNNINLRLMSFED